MKLRIIHVMLLTCADLEDSKLCNVLFTLEYGSPGSSQGDKVISWIQKPGTRRTRSVFFSSMYQRFKVLLSLLSFLTCSNSKSSMSNSSNISSIHSWIHSCGIWLSSSILFSHPGSELRLARRLCLGIENPHFFSVFKKKLERMSSFFFVLRMFFGIPSFCGVVFFPELI